MLKPFSNENARHFLTIQRVRHLLSKLIQIEDSITMKLTKTAAIAATISLAVMGAAQAGTLEDVKAKGKVTCGTAPGLPGFGMCGDRVQSHRADLTIGDQYVERRFSPVWKVSLLQILHGFYTVLLLLLLFVCLFVSLLFDLNRGDLHIFLALI